MAASLEQPKKAVPAYWLYLADHRDAIMKECGTGKGSVVSKAAGEKWKALPDAEKAPYEAKAAAQKAEYEKAMEDFKSQGGVPKQRRSAKDKEPKKEKDPDRPKKPVGGAYGIFLAEKREEISKTLPADHKMTDIAKTAGERWRGLSDAAKKPYEEQYAVKAEAYKKALEEYKQRSGKDEEGESGESEGSPTKTETQKTGRKRAAAGASASPPAKQRRGAKQTEAAGPAIDDALLQEAEKLGFTAALKNLASRPEVTKTGKDHKDMLNALKSSNGLVNAAKRALLGA